MLYFAFVNIPVKILIIRFSSIGDIVLTTPVIRCLKQQLEGEVNIHYLTKKAYTPLLETNPYIDKIYSIDKSTNEVIENLANERYDYIVDLHRNLRSSRIKRKLKALSFTFDKLNYQKWLLVNFKVNKLPDVHIVDRYLESIKVLGVENDGEGLDYFIPKETNLEIPENFKNNYNALVFGAAHFTKRIPKEKLIELIEASPNHSFILVGGKEDQSLGKELEKLYPQRIWNTCGKTTFHESAFLLKHAKKVISTDTGMMHIAAALQKPILSVWGNTVPEFGMYPYYKKGNEHLCSIFEVKNLNCRPCSKIGYDKCPKGHFKCMLNIATKEVAEKLNE